jgi:hypothetical protein
MKLVVESLNELYSFERKSNPLSSLGIGLKKLIEDWLDNSRLSKNTYNYEINDDYSVMIRYKYNDEIYKFIDHDYIKCLLTDECNKHLIFYKDTIEYILILDETKIDKIFRMFPDKTKQIISIIKYLYNSYNIKRDLPAYIINKYHEYFKYDIYFFCKSIKDINLIKNNIPKLTPNQELEVSYLHNYNEGIIDALKRGANPYNIEYDYFGWAVKENKIEIIKLMLKDDRLINRLNHSASRYLMTAIKLNNTEITKLLIPFFNNLGPQQTKVYNIFASKNNLSLK